MVFDTKAFGARVKLLRKGSALTQEQLAQQLHISVSHLGKIEIGCNAPSIDLILEIAEFFGVSVDYLLTGQTFSDSERNFPRCAINFCPMRQYNVWHTGRKRNSGSDHPSD